MSASSGILCSEKELLLGKIIAETIVRNNILPANTKKENFLVLFASIRKIKPEILNAPDRVLNTMPTLFGKRTATGCTHNCEPDPNPINKSEILKTTN